MMKPDREGRPIDELHAVNAPCGWCWCTLEIVRGVVACPECDVLARWPNYWR